MHDFITNNLNSLIYLAVFLVVTWFSLDMRSILKEGQKKNQLSIEGRWKDLEDHFKQASKPHRPFVWFHRKFLNPGNNNALYALFLYKQGRLEEALAKADEAIRQVDNKPRIFSGFYRQATLKNKWGALSAKILIFTGLGRYDEARQAADQLEQLGGAGNRPNAALAVLELNCGRLDEALALAQRAHPGDTQYDSLCGVAALAYSAKGEFDQAIKTLSYEPANAAKFYTAEGMKVLKETPEGAGLIISKERKLAGFFPPARLVMLANIYIARESFEDAAQVLDQAEKTMGPEPGLQISYCRHRACSLAGLGNAVEAEKYIERMRALYRQTPKRSFLWETHYAAGKTYYYLARLNDALAELNKAEQSALHPTEKHATAYLVARTYEAAGNQNAAISYYQTVAADLIPSWMRKHAIEVLNRQSS